MTQREFFTAIINGSATTKDGAIIKVLNEDGTFTDSAIEFAKGRIKALDTANENRKNGTSKSAQETAAKRAEIFDGMEFDKTYTAKEIADLFGLSSTQKATGLLSKMNGIIVSEFTPTGKKKDTVKGYTKPSAEVE